MEDLVNDKKLSDKQMLSNFVVLLNEKKSKIQYLTELLDAFKAGREQKNPPIKRTKKRRKPAKSDEEDTAAKQPKRELISDSESDEDAASSKSDPNDDYNSEEERKKRFITDSAIPTTSKADFGFLKEDTPPQDMQKIKPLVPRTTSVGKEGLIVENNRTVQETDEQTSQLQQEDAEEPTVLDYSTQDMLDDL